MTAPSADPEAQAFLALADTASVPVYDGKAPDTATGQYGVFYPTPGTVSSETLCLDPTSLTIQVQVTACGPTERDATAAASAIRTAVAGQILTVAGRTCGPIRQVPLNTPVRRDDTAKDTTDLPVYYQVVQFEWYSIPA